MSCTMSCAAPTVGGVEASALTLDTVQVDVTVSDDGGQPVLEYTVSQMCVNALSNKDVCHHLLWEFQRRL